MLFIMCIIRARNNERAVGNVLRGAHTMSLKKSSRNHGLPRGKLLFARNVVQLSPYRKYNFVG